MVGRQVCCPTGAALLSERIPGVSPGFRAGATPGHPSPESTSIAQTASFRGPRFFLQVNT
jgi:hypothetical protein